MARVLILGGGFGGIATAYALRGKLAANDEILVVERREKFLMGLRKNWALVGQSTLEAGQRPVEALQKKGIKVIPGTITAIDPAARAATVDEKRYEADALVVALGAELAPQQIPGLPEHGFNVYDPQEVPKAAEILRSFSGSRVLIGIFGAPYKCPPAPYEIGLLLTDSFRERGVKATIEVFTPQPMSLPVIGKAGSTMLEDRLRQAGITFLPSHKATAVEKGEVVFANGRRPFDLLLSIPPHRCPQVVVESGLSDGGWVKVNPRTLETKFPGVYAIGDLIEIPLANGMPLPKAGVFAEAMGQVVAERIAATLAGREPQATFQGVGHCFMEVGKGEAILVRGRFFVDPAPQVELTEASPQHLSEKHAFEEIRLRAWFGQ